MVVIVGSLLPGESPVMSAVAKLPVSDKVLHFTAYLVLATLAAWAQRGWRASIWFAAGLALLGAGLELAQYFVPGRSPEVADELANVLGVCCGLVAGRCRPAD
jgi:VanZ family protein